MTILNGMVKILSNWKPKQARNLSSYITLSAKGKAGMASVELATVLFVHLVLKFMLKILVVKDI